MSILSTLPTDKSVLPSHLLVIFLQNTQLPLPSHPLLNQTSLPNPHANATPGDTPADKKQSPPLIFCHVKVQGLEQASPIGSLPGQHLSVQIYSILS